MSCEICGAKIVGKRYEIFVEGSKLIVCEKCAKYGSVKPTRPKRLEPAQRNSPVPSVSRRSSTMVSRARGKYEDIFQEYELVEGYGRMVKEAREKLGWTQEDLAREIMEKESLIKKIEREEIIPPPNVVKKLERVLNIKLTVPPSEIPADMTVTPKSPPTLTIGDVVIVRRRKKK
ncbi:MAG: multiprotein bridging factor aMBF1 [Candidatus Baldrarchaeia archaeon]